MVPANLSKDTGSAPWWCAEHLIRFFPKHWEKVYGQWLENIEDWCISRQIWWGHRIPAWYAKSQIPGSKSQVYVGLLPPADAENWTQDPDTLDTWFSSWLWAYETMDAETRKKFYPTSALVTGPDIIFFWVARMIIAGLEFQPGSSPAIEDNIPFHDVYFTGLIRDKQGRKMSKSLGNSPDPIELMEKYGADGLRFALMRIAPSGQDIRFDEKQIEEGRNFCDQKLWNAARFSPDAWRERFGGEAQSSRRSSIYSVEVLARLNETIAAVEESFAEYPIQRHPRSGSTISSGAITVTSLVCRSGQDRHFFGRSGQEDRGIGGDGRRPVGNLAFAASVHAAYHRGVVAAAGPGQGHHSVR